MLFVFLGKGIHLLFDPKRQGPSPKTKRSQSSESLGSGGTYFSPLKATYSKMLKPSVSAKKKTPKRKPLKICGVKERTRIGVVAATLEELRSKIRTEFALSRNDFKVVLEEDCTVIEDEDYFQTLKDNTVLVVVNKYELWTGGTYKLSCGSFFLVWIDLSNDYQ